MPWILRGYKKGDLHTFRKFSPSTVSDFWHRVSYIGKIQPHEMTANRGMIILCRTVKDLANIG